MAALSTFVVDEADVEAVREDGDTASIRVTFQVEHLDQRVIRYAPGRSREVTADGRHDLLYVVAGRGEVELEGERHAVGAGTAVFVAPGETYAVENPGPGELLVVAVAARADLAVADERRRVLIRFADQPEQTASV